MPNEIDLKSSLRREFAGAPLGDQRLAKRLLTIADRVGEDPGASFPRMCPTDAELEALYRFLENERVTPEVILAAHFAATIERCAAFDEILLAEDSSEGAF